MATGQTEDKLPASCQQFTPYAVASIGHRTTDLLDKIIDENSSPTVAWSEVFTAHHFRHALVSYLGDINLPKKLIAEHLQNKGASIEDSYSLRVLRHWDIPYECVERAKQRNAPVSALVLIPYFHYYRTVTRATTCACDMIIRVPPRAAVPDAASSTLSE